MSHTTFVENLKQYKGNLPAHIQEEYLRADNTLDTKYISNLLESSITESRFRTMVNSELGTINFKRGKNENTVTREAFEELYTFGKFPNVRSWIGYCHRTLGLVLTRESLYEYLTPSK